MALKVWIQLYFGKEKSGRVLHVKVASRPQNRITDLAKAVHQANGKLLGHCDAVDLEVYKAGTEFPPKEEDELSPSQPVPKYSTGPKPLRVVAPARIIANQQDDQHFSNSPITQIQMADQTPASTGKAPSKLYQPLEDPSSEDGKLEGLNYVSVENSGIMQCSSTPACVKLLEIFEAVSNGTIEKNFHQAAEYFAIARNRLSDQSLPNSIGSNERFLTGAMANALNAVLDDGFAVLHRACLGSGNTHSDLSACRITGDWPKTLMVGKGKWSADNLRNDTRAQMLNQLVRHRQIDRNAVYSPILLLAFDNNMLELDLAFPSTKNGKLERDRVVRFQHLPSGVEAFWTVQLIRINIDGDNCSKHMAIILCFLSKALKELDSWPQTSRLQYKTPMPLLGEEDIESAVYYGDNVTKITTKEGTKRVYKEFCYHLREAIGNSFVVPDFNISKDDQRHPPPEDLLKALGQPYSDWEVTKGPLGISVLCYDFIEGSQHSPSVKGWIMILNQVNAMHKADYIHGDLLPRNVLFNGDKGYVIDFDLSRKVGAKYVEGYNHTEFQPYRHKGAKQREQMRKVHDLHALLEMSKAFFDVGQFAQIFSPRSDESDEEVQTAIVQTILVFEENESSISPNQDFKWTTDTTSSVERNK